VKTEKEIRENLDYCKLIFNDTSRYRPSKKRRDVLEMNINTLKWVLGD
jgi:hypothetical protein